MRIDGTEGWDVKGLGGWYTHRLRTLVVQKLSLIHETHIWAVIHDKVYYSCSSVSNGSFEQYCSYTTNACHLCTL